MSVAADRPLLRVLAGGEPTGEELAAMVAVVHARAASASGAGPGTRRSAWPDRATQLRRPLHPSPGAWRASLR